jgi:hypothetical protein
MTDGLATNRPERHLGSRTAAPSLATLNEIALLMSEFDW